MRGIIKDDFWLCCIDFDPFVHHESDNNGQQCNAKSVDYSSKRLSRKTDISEEKKKESDRTELHSQSQSVNIELI